MAEINVVALVSELNRDADFLDLLAEAMETEDPALSLRRKARSFRKIADVVLEEAEDE